MKAEDRWSRHLKQPSCVTLDQLFDLKRGSVAKQAVRISQFFMGQAFRLCFRLELSGIDRLPEKGPFLLCPNHQSYLDPFFIYALWPPALLERTLFIGDRAYFEKPWLSWMNRFGRVLLTGSSKKLPECFRLACDGLRRGMIVCVFPEGGLTRTGAIRMPYRGAGILSCETGAPIVPLQIHGALGAFSRLRPGFHFCRIRMTVGDPIIPETETGNEQIILEKWRNAILRMAGRQESGIVPEGAAEITGSAV